MDLREGDIVLPVSVIVTLSAGRRPFFQAQGLPSILANRPAEIIIEAAPGGMCERRNRGRRKATQPFLLFSDDDILFRPDYLQLLHKALLAAADDVAYAYCSYRIVKQGGEHTLPTGAIVQARPYDAASLWRKNYVSSISLFRAGGFPGWDERLKSYVDWDIAMTLAEQGKRGAFVNDVLFDAYCLDEGIHHSGYGPSSAQYIRRKHGHEPPGAATSTHKSPAGQLRGCGSLSLEATSLLRSHSAGTPGSLARGARPH